MLCVAATESIIVPFVPEVAPSFLKEAKLNVRIAMEIEPLAAMPAKVKALLYVYVVAVQAELKRKLSVMSVTGPGLLNVRS